MASSLHLCKTVEVIRSPVVSNEDERVRTALTRLMTKEATLDTLTDDQIVSAARSAKNARKMAEGRAAAVLHDRGWTWEAIGREFGVNQSTAHRWADFYRRHLAETPE